MGMDIHINIVKNKEYIAKEIFDGRNREWFDNLRGRGNDYEYDYLPVECYNYFPEEDTPLDLNIDKLKYDDYFDFRAIRVDKYIDWFEKYRPDKDAGWVTTYEKWKIENKGFIPDDIDHYLDLDANPADMHFIEIEKKYDCSRWLYNYLIDKDILFDAYIIYYFDC